MRHPVPSTRVVLLAAGFVAAGLVAASCGDDVSSTTTKPKAHRDVPSVRLALVGRYDQPVRVVPVPGTDLVAVVEKGGRVFVTDRLRCTTATDCPAKPVVGGDVIVDLRDEVSDGDEQGLLGMAFHPQWPDDPRIFLDYTDVDGDTRIEAWTLDTPTAPARRQRELLRIDQPFENHNGGHVLFGPDGLLYIATGDGGGAGDPADRAQQPEDLLGKLLRIDVDAGGERGFSIPDGNVPGGAPEVWAIGLRNPWRFSFDAKTGDLWIGDVGQSEREEVDTLERIRLDGGAVPNFGWRRREGFSAFDTSGHHGPGPLITPVLDYGRDDGCSITGGVVYRGRMIRDLRGWYVFADFCERDLRFFDADQLPDRTPRRGDVNWSSVDGAAQVASIDEIQHRELLVVSLDGGIRQVVPA